jgi:hypothetical protein
MARARRRRGALRAERVHGPGGKAFRDAVLAVLGQGMGHAHIPKYQQWDAYAQMSAGASWKAIQASQRDRFGALAVQMSRAAIFKAHKHGKERALAQRHAKVRPGQTLTAWHRILIDRRLARQPSATTEQLELMLLRCERKRNTTNPRTRFPHSTIDNYVRARRNTRKLLTVYDPRLDLFESALCRAAFKDLPPEAIIVIDGVHWDSRLSTQPRYGRSPIGTRAYARQFLGGDGQLRSVMAAMNMHGMVMEACQIMVRLLFNKFLSV